MSRRDNNMRNETIQSITQSINRLPALEQRRERLLERMEVSQRELAKLKASYDTQAENVKKLENSGVVQSFQKLIGKKSNKYNKAMIELLSSKFNYEKEHEHFRDLEEEDKDLGTRINKLLQKKAELQSEISRREKDIAANENHNHFDEYNRIMRETTAHATQLVENEEALKAARKVKGSASASLEELENAEQWATSEMWSGSGLVSHTTKLSKIDHAQSTFNRLSTQMKDLKRELADVHLSETTILSTISTANHMVEFWFDNILSSKDSAAVLRSNQAQIRVLITQVKALILLLEKNEEQLRIKLAALDQSKAELISNCVVCQTADGDEGASCGL